MKISAEPATEALKQFHDKFRMIGEFINLHRDLSETELNALLQEAAKGNEAFNGIVRVDKVYTPDQFKEVIVVILDKDHYPPDFHRAPGRAYPHQGVVFIKDIFSEAGYQSCLKHELYHMDHAANSIGMRLGRIIPGADWIHEVETIIAAQLLQNPRGAAIELYESIANDVAEFRHRVEGWRERLRAALYPQRPAH